MADCQLYWKQIITYAQSGSPTTLEADHHLRSKRIARSALSKRIARSALALRQSRHASAPRRDLTIPGKHKGSYAHHRAVPKPGVARSGKRPTAEPEVKAIRLR